MGKCDDRLVLLPDEFRDCLADFEATQARPIDDSALIARMQTEATKWINAVHMQSRRVARPLVNSDDLGAEVWRQEIDLYFLLVALTRLRRAISLAAQVVELRPRLNSRLAEFDNQVPYLSRLRNVSEHFDDYTVGRGRDSRVRRSQLQVSSLSKDTNGQLMWNWLGERVLLEAVHAAAQALYRGFLDDAAHPVDGPALERAVSDQS